MAYLALSQEPEIKICPTTYQSISQSVWLHHTFSHCPTCDQVFHSRIQMKIELDSLYPGTGNNTPSPILGQRFGKHLSCPWVIQLPAKEESQRSCHPWLEGQGSLDMNTTLIVWWKREWTCRQVTATPEVVVRGSGGWWIWAHWTRVVPGAPLLVISGTVLGTAHPVTHGY